MTLFLREPQMLHHRTTSYLFLLSVIFFGAPRAWSQTGLPEYQPLAGEMLGIEGAWENYRVDGSTVVLRVLRLSPRSEPKPALSVQLIPDDFHLKDGNAAVYYLQAMGFFEQSYAQRAKQDFEQKKRDAATAAGKSSVDAPPHSWRETRPENLPIEQVKEYLGYTSFQQRYLKEAVQRKRCDFNRHIRDVENPVMYLLPEIQSMRELARNQSLRFLLAIAEDRSEEAVAIFGQQLAIGAHLSQEPFLVSNLVGVACASIGWHDAFYLCEHQDAPNLYWALAALPRPLVDVRSAMSFERELLFQQFPALGEVDETPRSDLYWSRFVDEYSDALQELVGGDEPFSRLGKPGVVLSVAAGVPGARRFLSEVEGMTIEQLDALPNTQVFFLAARRYHELVRDELFKWEHTTHWAREKAAGASNEIIEAYMQDFGWIGIPSGLLLPAVRAAMSAQTGLEQKLVFLQTVEAIRHHLATHDEQLPATLDELELPAPEDPATGQPFHYLRHSQGATLSASQYSPGYRYQVELRVAK